MNLFIYTEALVASFYGIGTYINELVACLKDCADIKLHVIEAFTNDKEFKIETREGVKYWKIPTPAHKVNCREDYYYALVALLKLYITDTNNLVFHLNYLHNNYHLSRYLKDIFQCKIVTTVHYMEWAQIFMGDFSQVEVALKNEDIKSQFVSMSLNSEKKLLDASDKVICLTDYLLDMLIKIYNVDKLKIAIIPNGIRDVFDKKENNTNLKRDLRKKYHFLSEEKVVLYVGRLDEVKGLNNLIDSFHLLLKKEKNSHLLIVGGGKIYDYYLKKTADIFRKVSYTGWIEKEKLYELMCVADVGVIPSLHEPFGYVALEMMMHSLPVVSTDSLSCIFDNNINGKLVPILDIEGKYDIDQAVLCEAIYYMLKETEMAKNIGRNGRKKFKEQFEIEYFKNNMVQLYSNLF